MKKALLDTNVLLSFGDSAAREIVYKLFEAGYEPRLTFQNLAEYWSVATRPREVNGLGLNPGKVNDRIKQLINAFPLILESEKSVQLWMELCAEHQVSGKKVHDFKLAAIALSNEVDTIVTNNVGDFRPIQKLNVIASKDFYAPNKEPK